MTREEDTPHRLRSDSSATEGWDHRERRGGGGLLLVHAHPDDECFGTGGLIARTIAEGRRVDLVTCTGGEEGEIHDPDLDAEEAKPRLREIRREELECSVRALGGGNLRLHLLGYRDSGMMGTPSNERADVFWRADLEEAIGRLVKIVREARPQVMVSYDENGNYGHPDHINAHRIAVAAFEAAADGHRYPDAGQPHAVERFYETAFNREAFLGLILELSRRGVDLPWDMGDAMSKANDALGAMGLAGADTSDMSVLRRVAESLAETADPEQGSFGTPDAEVHVRLDVSAFSDQKRRAMDCHRTQRQDFGWLLDMPDDLEDRALATEYFNLTRWRDHEIPAGLRQDSLFPEG
jgi:N-acetyl-1-D-myo-inositol-2-amino-2-deoxy-alpha-D-glucopyranoside deacetylase